jgi:hypothetical protein
MLRILQQIADRDRGLGPNHWAAVQQPLGCCAPRQGESCRRTTTWVARAGALSLRCPARPALQARRNQVVARADKKSQDTSEKSKGSKKQDEDVKKAVDAMKKDGVDEKVARKACSLAAVSASASASSSLAMHLRRAGLRPVWQERRRQGP